MRNKKIYNLVLMLGILTIHTFTLRYWLSNETKELLKKTEKSGRLNIEKKNIIPVLKVDSNIQKSLNSSSALRQ